MNTDHELIELYLKFKAVVAKKKDAYEAEVEPYVKGMATIENEFLKRLDERGADNTKTDVGTAYRSTITNFNVVDQQAFLQFCLQYPSLSDIYTIKPVKDPIKEYMNGGEVALPPGLEQTQFTRINVRRT